MTKAETNRTDETFHVSPCVRFVLVGDRVTILDIRSESYFALEPAASRIWVGLAAGQTRQECLNDIHRNLSPDMAPGDVDDFVDDCLKKGLISPMPQDLPEGPVFSKHASPSRSFLRMRAWLCLLRTVRSLARDGFFAVYTKALATPVASTGGGPPVEKVLKRGLKAFAAAENFFHLKKAPRDCLPRSLALFLFLRSLGLPAEHFIGVRHFPFTAHAWTECDGQVVHDDPAVRETFCVIARIGP